MAAGKPSFFLDSKGLCFLCLQETNPPAPKDPLAMDEDLQHQSAEHIWSFEMLARYLSVDFRNVLHNISVPLQTTGVLENSQLMVSLCEDCSGDFSDFSSLYREFEILKIRLNSTVQKLGQTLHKVQRDKEVQDEYHRRMRTSVSDAEGGIVITEIIANLRKETLAKCNQYIHKEIPKVLVEKVVCSNGEITRAVKIDDDNEEEDPLASYVDESVDRTPSPFQEEEPIDDNMLFDQSNQEESDSEEDVSENEEIDDESSDTKPIIGPRGRKIYHCYDCDKYVADLDAHKRKHVTNKQLQCEHCDRAFLNRSVHMVHNVTKHFEKSFINLKKSDITDNLFKAAVDLLLHRCELVRSVPDAGNHKILKKKFECFYCHEMYAFKPKLRCHLAKIHYGAIKKRLVNLQHKSNHDILKRHAQLMERKRTLKSEYLKNMEEKTVYQSSNLTDTGIAPHLLIPRQGAPKCPWAKTKTREEDEFERTTTTCTACGLVLPTRPDFITHTRLECKIVDKIISSNPPSELVRSNSFWRRRKAAWVWVKCDICRKSFRTVFLLNHHKAMQHPPPTTHTLSTMNEFCCDYCIKKFRFFFSYRIHLLTTHREQVFSTYAPPGTKPHTVNEVVKTILREFKELPNKSKRCNFCTKEFKKLIEIENHIIVSHYDEAVVQFQDILNVYDDATETEESDETEEQSIPKILTEHNKPGESSRSVKVAVDGFTVSETNTNTTDVGRVTEQDVKKEVKMENEDVSICGDNTEALEISVDPFSIH